MEAIKYSILVSPYSNGYQFENFLYTACRQDYNGYEVIVFDNGTPSNEIRDACIAADTLKVPNMKSFQYHRILEQNKKCRNITHGINEAAKVAKGEYVVIVADSNVLLSYNVLSEIDAIPDKRWRVVISGAGTDIKISPNGNAKAEYTPIDYDVIAKANEQLLQAMGWPDDPNNLKLLKGQHRYPPPHDNFDIYLVCMNREIFLDSPYNEKYTSWGDYHSNFVKNKCIKYSWERLQNIRIIHQYHRVWKEEDAVAYN